MNREQGLVFVRKREQGEDFKRKKEQGEGYKKREFGEVYNGKRDNERFKRGRKTRRGLQEEKRTW